MLRFASPVKGSEILCVERSVRTAGQFVGLRYKIASCQCRLRTDLLAQRPSLGIYVEFEVRASLPAYFGLRDGENGNSDKESRIYFAPHIGTVEFQRSTEMHCSVLQLLHELPDGPVCFAGSIGIYLQNSQLAFFRRCRGGPSSTDDDPLGQWESTGFCFDLSWSKGDALSLFSAFTPCSDFRARISKFGTTPPFMPTNRCICNSWRTNEE